MRTLWMTLLGIALLGATLTAAIAAGQGRRGEARQAGACQVATADAVTLTGQVTEATLPEPGRRMGPAMLTLQVGKESAAVLLGPPHALAALELKPGKGDTLTVAGWTVTRDGKATLVAREVTLNGKTYTLREADGKPTWMGRGNGQGMRNGCGRGQGNGERRRDGSCQSR